MNRFIYFVVIVLFCIGFYGCETENLGKEQNNSFSKQPDNSYVQLLYDHFSTLEDEEIFNELGIWGTPYWNKELAYGYAGNEVYLIPLADENTKCVDAIIFLYVDTDYLRYQMCINDQDQYLDKELGLIFNFFENELFGVKEDYLYPSPLEETYLGKTKATMIDFCNEVWAGSPSTGWSYRGSHCWTKVIHESFDRENDETGGWGGSIHGEISNPFGGGSGLLSPLPKVDEDKSWENTKADCVKQKLEAGGANSILNNLLAGFKLNSSVIDVKFYVSNIDYRGKKVKNGMCVYNQTTKKVYIYLSENRLNKSSLEVARTILHESFHAYLYGKIHDGAIHNGLAPDPDFVTDFNNYAKVYGKGSSNSAQHNYMATMYIRYMKEGLKEFFNSDPHYMEYASNNSSDDRWNLDSMFEGLAWGGLRGTDSWKDFKLNNPAKVNDFNLQLSYFVNSYGFPKDCD